MYFLKKFFLKIIMKFKKNYYVKILINTSNRTNFSENPRHHFDHNIRNIRFLNCKYVSFKYKISEFWSLCTEIFI